MNLEGGCLCGAVRYKFSGEPFRHVICHCRDCQRASGSAFHVGLAIPRSGFAVTRGELRTFRITGDSGRWIDRSFCPVCGSGILHTLELRGPDFLVIKAGTLDDPTMVIPTYEIFVRSKMPWVSISGETTKLDEMLPRPSQAHRPDA
jgi:hypothetical protein